jgi:hypothetical protein
MEPMRSLVLSAAGLLILITFLSATGELRAQEPDTIKVTVTTDKISATMDGVYRVTLEASSSDGSVSPSFSEPITGELLLKKGDLVSFSREFSFKDSEFDWKLTITPPLQEGDETRPMILRGRGNSLDALVRPLAQSGTSLSASAYIQTQPPSHGLDIGDTPISIKLSVFVARMNACSGLEVPFETGEYVVNIWMDGNSNHQRDSTEEKIVVTEPDLDGKICVPMELLSLTEAVDYEYEFIDPKGQSVGKGLEGSYDFGTNSIGGKFPEGDFRWTGVGFHGSEIETEVKLMNPFKAFLTEADKTENFKKPTDMCVRILPYECPDIAVPPPSSFDGLPLESYWEKWPDRIKDNRAYIPAVGLIVGLIGVGLQLRRRRNT